MRIEARVHALAEPIAADLGVEILAVRFAGGRTPVVRVILDRPGGVDCDLLEAFSRALSLQLDAENPIAGRYRLEVSSPGLDWPMKEPADFRRHLGERWRLVMRDGRTLSGRGLAAEDGRVRLRTDDGAEREVALAEVARAVREPETESHPKRGGKR